MQLRNARMVGTILGISPSCQVYILLMTDHPRVFVSVSSLASTKPSTVLHCKGHVTKPASRLSCTRARCHEARAFLLPVSCRTISKSRLIHGMSDHPHRAHLPISQSRKYPCRLASFFQFKKGGDARIFRLFCTLPRQSRSHCC